MLRLSKTLPAPARADFGGGAFAMVRPASSVDYERARQQAGAMAAAIATTDEALALFSQVSGRPPADVPTAEDVIASAHSLALMFLAAECITEIRGVAVGDEVMTAPLTPDQTALLVRDVQIATALEERIFARIALEADEGNGSPPSRGGAPGADGTIAGDAGHRTSLAPAGFPVATASAALRSDIIH